MMDGILDLCTGTCGQDPMVPLIAHPPFFLNIDFFFFMTHVHNILSRSMYHSTVKNYCLIALIVYIESCKMLCK